MVANAINLILKGGSASFFVDISIVSRYNDTKSSNLCFWQNWGILFFFPKDTQPLHR